MAVADELLEAGIFAERVPKRIELEVCTREASRDFEQMRKNGDRRIVIAEACLDLRQRSQSPRLVHLIRVVIFDRTLRLLQSFCLFSKPGIGESKSIRCAVGVCVNRCIRFRFNRFDSARETSTRILIPPCPLLTKTKLDKSELGNGVERLSRGN